MMKKCCKETLEEFKEFVAVELLKYKQTKAKE